MAQRCRDKLGFKFQRLTPLMTGSGSCPSKILTRLPALGELHSNGNAVLQLVGSVPKAHFSPCHCPHQGWAQPMCTCASLAASLGWHSSPWSHGKFCISKQRIPAAAVPARRLSAVPHWRPPSLPGRDTQAQEPRTRPAPHPLFPAHAQLIQLSAALAGRGRK